MDEGAGRAPTAGTAQPARPATGDGRIRSRHALIAAVATIAILVAVPIAVVTYRPSWTLRPIAVATPGEGLSPRGWSPDGTRMLFSRLDQWVVVRVADAARVANGYGAWPTWVDDDTIDAIQDIGAGRSQILQARLSGPGANAMRSPTFETARLIGNGPLELAATTSVGSIWASVVDPRTGRVIADLPGVRAIGWAGPGRLIAKTSELSPGVSGQLPGHLRAWTARDGLHPIGGDLLEIAEGVSAAPSGDVIACVCARAADGPTTGGSIHLVPLDGGPARKLLDLSRGDRNIQTNVGWLPDGSLIVLDGVGYHRFARDGTELPVPTIAAEDFPPTKYAARAYVLGGDLVIGSQLESGPTGQVRLTIRHLDGDVVLSRTLPSWNGLGLVVDAGRARALVATDPQIPGGESEAFFLLERS
jgi:hypothetical protein